MQGTLSVPGITQYHWVPEKPVLNRPFLIGRPKLQQQILCFSKQPRLAGTQWYCVIPCTHSVLWKDAALFHQDLCCKFSTFFALWCSYTSQQMLVNTPIIPDEY